MIVGTRMSNSASDQKQFGEVLNSIEDNTGKTPEKTSADAGYFSADNIKAAEEAKTDAYIAGSKEGKHTGNPYDKTNFTYQVESDTYICPAGKIMTLKYTQYANDPQQDTRWVYETGDCQGCPYQKDCVKSKSGKRKITRTESDPIREAMRTKVQSDQGKAIYMQRKAIVEPVWGVIKEIQGFRQFNLRGEDKITGKFMLLALSYNLRKLLDNICFFICVTAGN